MAMIKIGNLDVSYFKVGSGDCTVYLGSTLLYSGRQVEPFFTIRSLANNNTITLTNSTASGSNFSYSTDSGTTWTSFTIPSGSTQTISTLASGDTVMMKGSNTTLGVNTSAYLYFRGSANYEIEGKLISLLNNNTTDNNINDGTNNFIGLFRGDTNLVSAENLIMPDNVTQQCYRQMFQGCTSLTKAPSVLPATTLANTCYRYMFSGCTSLTTAPILPAETLVSTCYYSMFNGCTSLNNITCLATNISANSCLSNWVNNVASSGTFTKASSMNSWPSGNNGIPSGWSVQNYTT